MSFREAKEDGDAEWNVSLTNPERNKCSKNGAREDRDLEYLNRKSPSR